MISRRSMLRTGALAAAATVGAPAILHAQTKTLKITTWGGKWGDIMKATVLPAFEKEFKCTVSADQAFPFMPKLQASAKNDPLYDVFHTNSTYARGAEMACGTYNWLDLVPKGRDEDDLAFTMAWIRHHDRYEDGRLADVRRFGILRTVARDLDRFTDLQRVFPPAGPEQRVRGAALHAEDDGLLAVRIGRFHTRVDVGISPVHFLHLAGERDGLGGIEFRRNRVVRHDGSRGRQKTDADHAEYKAQQLSRHNPS